MATSYSIDEPASENGMDAGAMKCETLLRYGFMAVSKGAGASILSGVLPQQRRIVG
jgi:hypothetical protein